MIDPYKVLGSNRKSYSLLNESVACITAIFLLPVCAEVLSVTVFRRCHTSEVWRSFGDCLRVVWKDQPPCRAPDSMYTKCCRSLEYYDSESVKPYIRSYTAQRPPMGGFRKTRIPIRCFHETATTYRACCRVESSKNWGCCPPFLRDGPLIIFTMNLSNFLEIFTNCMSLGPVYELESRSRVAGVKIAKNGMSDCGWVDLGGSLLNCATGNFNIFGGYVSRHIWQHHTYIYET